MKITKDKGKGKTYTFTDVTRAELEYLYHINNCNPCHCTAEYYGMKGLILPHILSWEVFRALQVPYKKGKEK